MSGLPTRGTISLFTAFNPEADCKKLYRAMQGFSVDKVALVAIICYRSNGQRQTLNEKYRSMFGKTLVHELSEKLGVDFKDISGNFRKVMLGLMVPTSDYDAYCAMKALDESESDFIEIVASRTNEEMREMSIAFKKLFNYDMEDIVAQKVSGGFEEIVMSLMKTRRDSSQCINYTNIQEDVLAIQESLQNDSEDDSTKLFTEIFSSRSYKHLSEMFVKYKEVSNGSTIEEVIKKEMSSDRKVAFLTIVEVSKGRTRFYAARLHKSLVGGWSDNDTALRYLLTSSSERDLVQIKENFKTMYGIPLYTFIQAGTSGDYQQSLLALCKN